VPGPTLAEEVCTRPASSRVLHGDTIGLLFEDPRLEPVVGKAISLWQSCRAYGEDFPHLVAGMPGTRPLTVEVRKQSVTDSCGTFSGNRIVLFESARTEGGLLRPCGSLASNLAHELGHAFGLGDSPRETRCQNHIMARLDFGNLVGRRVQPRECHVVGERWLTFAEGSPAFGTSVERPGVASAPR
jgi:hypothetical protein